MGGNQSGDSGIRKIMDFLPEIAPGFRVNSGCGFVQQQQFGFVYQACGQRQPLFPAAGQSSGQLLFTSAETGALNNFPHGFFTLRNIVQPGNQFDVFSYGQVFVQTESLGHVTDPPFNGILFFKNIQSQAGSGGGIRRQQAAEYPDKSGFAAAVGAQKAIYFAFFYLHGEVVDHDLSAETFSYIGNVNDKISFRGSVCEFRIHLLPAFIFLPGY